MKKLMLGLGVILLMTMAMPLFAQGPFADVPTDHWAYDAVNELQQAGIVIGYPDGTYGGKRPMSRYEFAVAIARAIPQIVERVKSEIQTPDLSNLATKQDVADLREEIGKVKASIPDTSKFVTQDQFKALQALVNEFQDELKNLGVEVESVKRDVAALAARVDILEKEMRRVRFYGDVMIGGISTKSTTGVLVDRDNRPGQAGDDLLTDISYIQDMDLKVVGQVSPATTVFADVNWGNYLPAGGYLDGVITDFVGTPRPTAGTADAFIPYYTYIQTGLGKGMLTAGRMPMQLTPYTLKLIDVDTYHYNAKLDSGNYPLDGAQFGWNFGSVGVQLFAAKTNQNSILGPGLVSHATGGLYPLGGFYTVDDVVVDGTGAAAGGLDATDQVAGARANIGTPWKGNLGLTYMNVAGPATGGISEVPGAGYNEVQVYGADYNVTLGSLPISLAWTQTQTQGDGVVDIDDNNNAFDGSFGFDLGNLGIDLGYRMVENNFGAPGYWERLGRWANPTNIQGPYASFTYPIASKLQFVAKGAFYEGANTIAGLPGAMDTEDDEVWRAEGGLNWGLSKTNSLQLGYELVRWNPDEGGNSKEQYINIGFGTQLSGSSALTLGYQIVDYKTNGADVYGDGPYEGGIAMATFNAKF